jgi:aspartyl-tRNA synthetase
MIFFGADNKKVADAMGALRLKLGKDLSLTEQMGAAVGYRLPDVLKTTVKAA